MLGLGGGICRVLLLQHRRACHDRRATPYLALDRRGLRLVLRRRAGVDVLRFLAARRTAVPIARRRRLSRHLPLLDRGHRDAGPRPTDPPPRSRADPRYGASDVHRRCVGIRVSAGTAPRGSDSPLDRRPPHQHRLVDRRDRGAVDGVDPDAAPNGVPRCDRRVGASRYRGTGNRQSRIRGRRARWHVSTRRPARSHLGCRPVDDRGGRGARARSCAAARTRQSDTHFRPDRARRGIDRRSRRHECYGDRGDRASGTRRRCRDHHRHRHVDHRSARAVLVGCRPAVRAAPRRGGRESDSLADELTGRDGVRGAQSPPADGSRTGRHQRPRPRGTGAGRESRRAFARERPEIGLRLARFSGDAGCAGESDRCLRRRAAPVRGSLPAARWK